MRHSWKRLLDMNQVLRRPIHLKGLTMWLTTGSWDMCSILRSRRFNHFVARFILSSVSFDSVLDVEEDLRLAGQAWACSNFSVSNRSDDLRVWNQSSAQIYGNTAPTVEDASRSTLHKRHMMLPDPNSVSEIASHYRIYVDQISVSVDPGRATNTANVLVTT